MKNSHATLTRIAALSLMASALACGGPEEDPASRAERTRTARADSVAMAEARYDPAVFDTLTWESSDVMLSRGRTVWHYSCQKCHGPEGRGDGEMARQAEFDVPSLRVPDWPYEGDVLAIRHRIFVGHESEMPNWGLHGMKYRDIDAVARYIDGVLRNGG